MHAPVMWGQYDYEDTTTVVYQESPGDNTTANGGYDSRYYFSDSAQDQYNHSNCGDGLDKGEWKKRSNQLSFEEKKEKKKEEKEKKKEKGVAPVGANLWALKYVFIAMAALIVLFILYKIWPSMRQRNLRNKQQLMIQFDELDEESLKKLDIKTPLDEAIRNGDYRTAYRLRYLEILKVLTSRNLIYYRKERTNYEYLLQLTGKPVYEPFRLLTFNFDGIWYGDLEVNKEVYEALEVHFTDFYKGLGEI